jgi:hypothetical protein
MVSSQLIAIDIYYLDLLFLAFYVESLQIVALVVVFNLSGRMKRTA